MTTSTNVNLVGITLKQKPNIPECRLYWLEVSNEEKRQELQNFVHRSYEEDEAVVQSAISEGYATLVSVTDLPVL